MATLDVRPILNSGGEPFDLIMQTVSQLQDNEHLELFVPFEPVPLYTVLGQMGYSHKTQRLDNGDFHIVFYKEV
jgi:uncharacterized protein (DUF2249 family)